MAVSFFSLPVGCTSGRNKLCKLRHYADNIMAKKRQRWTCVQRMWIILEATRGKFRMYTTERRVVLRTRDLKISLIENLVNKEGVFNMHSI